MDITAITAVLTSVKSAMDIAKNIKDSGASLEAAETKLKLAELIGALADVKVESANVKEILVEKDAEIRKLRDQLDMKEKLVWKKPYYVMKGREDEPLCQRCYDDEGKTIRLQIPGRQGLWICSVCKTRFTNETYKLYFAATTPPPAAL